MLKAVKDWGALVTAVLAAVAGLTWIGELRSDVRHLADELGSLKREVAALKQPPSAKGDMCRMMTERIGDALDEGRQLEGEQLAEQMNKMGCYGLAIQPTDERQKNSL